MKKRFPIRFISTEKGNDFRPVGRLRSATLRILRQEKMIRGKIQVFWITEREMANMNYAVKKRRASTDVLSYPRADGEHLGDVFVAPSYALKIAREKKYRVKDVVLRWVVHGIFHILGYDHADPLDARVMETKEREVIGHVGGVFVTP